MRTEVMKRFVVVAVLWCGGILTSNVAADVLDNLLEARQGDNRSVPGAERSASAESPSSEMNQQAVAQRQPPAEYCDSPLVAVAIGCCALSGVIVVVLSIRAHHRAVPQSLMRL